MPTETPPPKSHSPGTTTVITEKPRPNTPSSAPPTPQDVSRQSPTSHQASGSAQQQFPSPTSAAAASATSSTGQSGSQQFCLRWNNYQTNLTSVFDQLLQNESFVDVTLACDGQSIKAHKMVLSACSPYFQALFFDNPCQHPIIIMRDVKWPELKAAVEFMYKGEINVSQDQIGPLLRVAEMLKIRGLADVNGEPEGSTASSTQTASSTGTPEIAAKKARLSREWELSNVETGGGSVNRTRKRRWPSADNCNMNAGSPQSGIGASGGNTTPDTHLEAASPVAAAPNASQIPHPQAQTPNTLPSFPIPTPIESMGLSTLGMSHADDMEIKPGIAEMIREEERAKLMENSHAWLGASTSSIADYSSLLKVKAPTWNQSQLREAMYAVITQKMRFTQASAHYNIPKGTLYDNILGKSNRMQVLVEAGLSREQEEQILDYCCEVSATSRYIRRTKKPISIILEFVRNLTQDEDIQFEFSGKNGFRWWWAFCKKYEPTANGDSYQYQLQSMWQKCWNTNQNLMHHLRFRERGPLKSWRPETMAEAIFSVLKEGLSLSQAARKYDIPYPTFVLYANRVHNMLGPSIDGGTDLRPKGRGRPQRILLGIWPDDHIKGVIKTVVFRDAKDIKDEGMHLAYGRHSPVFPFQEGQMNYAGAPCANGLPQQPAVSAADAMSPEATAAAVAAVAHGIRQQMQMAAAAQHHPDASSNLFNLPPHMHANNGGIPIPKQNSPASNSQRHASPSIPGLPNPAALGITGIPGLHIIPGLGSNASQTSASANSIYTSNSSNQQSSTLHTTSASSGSINISRNNSPSEAAHDLRMNSPDESPLNSPLEMALEPAVNLAVGVSGMAYKPSRGYSSPRPEHLFQEDIAELVGTTSRNCPSNMNNFKEPSAGIKLEPVAECRSE